MHPLRMMAAQEKHRSPSAALYCATFPICGRRSSIRHQRAPELCRAAPASPPPSLLFIWPFTWQEETGRQGSRVCQDNRRARPGSRASSVGDGSRVRVPSEAAGFALMRLNNILHYLVWGRRGRRPRSCRGEIKRPCLFGKAKMIGCFICLSVFHNNCLSHCQDMPWRATTAVLK